MDLGASAYEVGDHRRAVQWHVRSILAKLEVTSRKDATIKARSRGLV